MPSRSFHTMAIYKKVKPLSWGYYKESPCRQLPTFRRNELRPSSDLSNSHDHAIHKLATLKPLKSLVL